MAGADWMHSFLERHSNGYINTETKQKETKVGDIVLFNWGGKTGWDHAGVITKMKNGKAYVSAHARARLNKPLDYYIASSKGTWADIFHVVLCSSRCTSNASSPVTPPTWLASAPLGTPAVNGPRAN
ncbi:amidase domain-containing protein [Streptomyces sp. SID2888]|uniref:amidase domain-containing protein n=1 Tax=Streptomyces TaxID=1883 RepID=UPI0031F64B0F